LIERGGNGVLKVGDAFFRRLPISGDHGFDKQGPGREMVMNARLAYSHHLGNISIAEAVVCASHDESSSAVEYGVGGGGGGVHVINSTF
jgi:hypothetical protein